MLRVQLCSRYGSSKAELYIIFWRVREYDSLSGAIDQARGWRMLWFLDEAAAAGIVIR